MPNQADDVLLHTMSGTELSRVRTELHRRRILTTVPPHPVQADSQPAPHRYLGNAFVRLNLLQLAADAYARVMQRQGTVPHGAGCKAGPLEARRLQREDRNQGASPTLTRQRRFRASG